MGDKVEGLLRLAWQADGDCKPDIRDALLTLVVAESVTEDAGFAERCRRLLTERQPGHWFATSPTLGQALARVKVVDALEKLRAMFPPVRVQWLLMRGEIRRGPYTGRVPSLGRLLDDLDPSFESETECEREPRWTKEEPSSASHRALPFPGSRPGEAEPGAGADTSGAARTDESDLAGSLVAFYLSVLLAIAVLINRVLEPATKDNKAA